MKLYASAITLVIVMLLIVTCTASAINDPTDPTSHPIPQRVPYNTLIELKQFSEGPAFLDTKTTSTLNEFLDRDQPNEYSIVTVKYYELYDNPITTAVINNKLTTIQFKYNTKLSTWTSTNNNDNFIKTDVFDIYTLSYDDELITKIGSAIVRTEETQTNLDISLHINKKFIWIQNISQPNNGQITCFMAEYHPFNLWNLDKDTVNKN